nr:MAG TPA: hypothetical protein [Caudoviricetes sp.]
MPQKLCYFFTSTRTQRFTLSIQATHYEGIINAP